MPLLSLRFLRVCNWSFTIQFKPDNDGLFEYSIVTMDSYGKSPCRSRLSSSISMMRLAIIEDKAAMFQNIERNEKMIAKSTGLSRFTGDALSSSSLSITLTNKKWALGPFIIGRSREIRTHGLCVPNAARYQLRYTPPTYLL